MRRILSPDERRVRDARRREEAERALRDLSRMEDAFKANYYRLKSERLERERDQS